MKSQKKSRHLIAGLLALCVLFVIGSLAFGYNVTPSEAYSTSLENLVEDGGFENFNEKAGDCCKAETEVAKIFAAKSSDSMSGQFSLNLTSSNRCACINKKVTEIENDNRYLLSFYYKGDNPKFCNWVTGDNKCLPVKSVEAGNEWKEHKEILSFTKDSLSSSIYFYADSRDGKTYTNLYDNLQVRKLIPITNPSDYQYNSEKEYIIKTKADNKVDGELISEIDAQTGEAYFLVKGKPAVTIKFPWSEIVIIVIMMVIIVRLLFKKDDKRII